MGTSALEHAKKNIQYIHKRSDSLHALMHTHTVRQIEMVAEKSWTDIWPEATMQL